MAGGMGRVAGRMLLALGIRLQWIREMKYEVEMQLEEGEMKKEES